MKENKIPKLVILNDTTNINNTLCGIHKFELSIVNDGVALYNVISRYITPSGMQGGNSKSYLEEVSVKDLNKNGSNVDKISLTFKSMINHNYGESTKIVKIEFEEVK